MTPIAAAARDDDVEAAEKYYLSFEDDDQAFREALGRAWELGARWALEMARSAVEIELE